MTNELTHPFLPDDDLVAIAQTNAVDAELIAAHLRGAGIPAAVFGIGTAGELVAIQHAEGSRVMVRRSDREVATQLVADLETDAPVSDEDLAAAADEATGYSDPSTGAVV